LFIMAVAAGTASTVLLATRLGLPVSTTHALIGGLIGAGLAQHGQVHVANLSQSFLLPLLISPVLAALLGAIAMRLMQTVRKDAAQKDCACLLQAPALQAPFFVVAADAACDRLNAPAHDSWCVWGTPP
jgi:PiT family inorganic phosphate transporter